MAEVDRSLREMLKLTGDKTEAPVSLNPSTADQAKAESTAKLDKDRVTSVVESALVLTEYVAKFAAPLEKRIILNPELWLPVRVLAVIFSEVPTLRLIGLKK